MRLLNNIYGPQIRLIQPFFYSLTRQPRRIINTLLLLFSCLLSANSQGCLHDTIPSELICKQDYIYHYGYCGNEEVFASEFAVSAVDNCSPVTITFDREGKLRWIESIMLSCDPNWPMCEVQIFARDTSGNVSECTAKYIAVPPSQTKTFTCDLRTGFYEENDKIQLKVRTNDNATYIAKLIKDRDYSLDFQVTIEGNQSIQSLIVEGLDKPFVYNNITTFDLIQILYEIIGIGRFSSPVNYLSEDTDCNGEINLLDVYKSEKYLLGVILADSCIAKPILYFIDEYGNILGNEIAYQLNPTKFPVIAFNQIGDINRYLPISNTTQPNSITKFGGDPLVWKVSQINCIKGNQYSVDYTLSDSTTLFGLQCNFAYDSNLIQVDGFHTNFPNTIFQHIYPNDIRFDWINISNPKFENDYPKATILFTAKSDFNLNEAFKPSQQSISNFAITSDGIVRPFATEFSVLNAADYADMNDPWIKVASPLTSQMATIYGSIAPFQKAELIIYSNYGQPIYNEKIQTIDGQINESIQLSNPGVYFLVLKLPTIKQLTQTFVVIR